MTDAVIVSTARTPLGKSWRGSFNMTHGATLAGHAIAHAVQRAGIDPAEVEDVVMGCALQQGATGYNIGRYAALRAGLPVTAGGTSIDRQCASGLQAIALAAQRIIVDQVPLMVAGGVESISCVQGTVNTQYLVDEWVKEHRPVFFDPLIHQVLCVHSALHTRDRLHATSHHQRNLINDDPLCCQCNSL